MFRSKWRQVSPNNMNYQTKVMNMKTKNNVSSSDKINMKHLPIVEKCSSADAVQRAADHLKASNVIALPTDTVYGLACSANNREAIQKLYEIKGRQETKPVAICVASIADLRHWGEASHLPDELLQKLLPGAVTIVLNRSAHLDNPYLNRGVSKIGIRIPDFAFIQEVSRVYGFPIALTSANRSAEKSTLNVDEFQSLWAQLGAVFDGGRLGKTEEHRAASTVVDLSEPGRYKIIRDGVAVHTTICAIEQFDIVSQA